MFWKRKQTIPDGFSLMYDKDRERVLKRLKLIERRSSQMIGPATHGSGRPPKDTWVSVRQSDLLAIRNAAEKARWDL